MRNLVIIAGLIIAGAGTGNARSVAPAETVQPKSTSPFEIARVLNQSTRQWKRHRVKVDVDLRPTWKDLGIEPNLFAGCSGDCEAKLDRQELDSTPGREVVLKLTQSYNFCRYLIFTRVRRTPAARPRWKLLGYIDHDFNRYQMARHRILSVDGQNFLVIRGQEGSGSGFALYGETWYQVREHGLKPVLYYPVEGNTYPWPSGLGRKFNAQVSPHTGGNNQVTVHYTVSYTTLNYVRSKFEKLLVNQHRAQYKWDKQSGTFVFKPAQSNISEAEIYAIANIQSEEQPEPGTKIGNTTFYSMSEAKAFVGGGYEVFLKYNSKRLLKIAVGRNVERKQWLKQFLDECEDMAEKKVLLQALQKQ